MHLSHCVEPCTGAGTAEGDPSEHRRRGAARSRWLGVCGEQRASGKGGQGLGCGGWSPCQHGREQTRQRAGLTCREAQPRRGVDGPHVGFRGLRCGAITAGLGRHDTAVVHSSGGPWRRSCTPATADKKTRRRLFFVVVCGQRRDVQLYSCMPIRDPLRDAVHSSAATNPPSLPFFRENCVAALFPLFLSRPRSAASRFLRPARPRSKVVDLD